MGKQLSCLGAQGAERAEAAWVGCPRDPAEHQAARPHVARWAGAVRMAQATGLSGRGRVLDGRVCIFTRKETEPILARGAL